MKDYYYKEAPRKLLHGVRLYSLAQRAVDGNDEDVTYQPFLEIIEGLLPLEGGSANYVLRPLDSVPIHEEKEEKITGNL